MARHLAPALFRARSLALEEYRCRIDESSLDEHIISDCLAQVEVFPCIAKTTCTYQVRNNGGESWIAMLDWKAVAIIAITTELS